MSNFGELGPELPEPPELEGTPAATEAAFSKLSSSRSSCTPSCVNIMIFAPSCMTRFITSRRRKRWPGSISVTSRIGCMESARMEMVRAKRRNLLTSRRKYHLFARSSGEQDLSYRKLHHKTTAASRISRAVKRTRRSLHMSTRNDQH